MPAEGDIPACRPTPVRPSKNGRKLSVAAFRGPADSYRPTVQMGRPKFQELLPGRTVSDSLLACRRAEPVPNACPLECIDNNINPKSPVGNVAGQKIMQFPRTDWAIRSERDGMDGELGDSDEPAGGSINLSEPRATGKIRWENLPWSRSRRGGGKQNLAARQSSLLFPRRALFFSRRFCEPRTRNKKSQNFCINTGHDLIY